MRAPVFLSLDDIYCTYGVKVVYVNDRDDKRQLHVAYKAIFRKIFRYSYHESVTNLQHVLGRLTWEELTDKRQAKFMNRCRQFNDNSLVHALSMMSFR